MFKYFDKNFFKFLIGFVAIVGISYLLLVVANLYQAGQLQTASTDTSVSP